jgi:hypothetical protein
MQLRRGRQGMYIDFWRGHALKSNQLEDRRCEVEQTGLRNGSNI